MPFRFVLGAFMPAFTPSESVASENVCVFPSILSLVGILLRVKSRVLIVGGLVKPSPLPKKRDPTQRASCRPFVPAQMAVGEGEGEGEEMPPKTNCHRSAPCCRDRP